MPEPRDVTWDGFVNARDLGGLPTRQGAHTTPGAFIRSGDLRFVTQAGWVAAWNAGVRTIVDLRNDDEVSRDHSLHPGATVVTLERVRLPLDGIDDVDFWADLRRQGLDGTPLYLRSFLDRKAERCAAVIRALARTAPGGVLFHCGAGRDRTGLVALLLLALADVEPEAIAEDYAASASRLAPVFAAMGRPDEGPIIELVMRRRGTTTREAIRDLLTSTDVAAVLLDAGARHHDVDTVRARLLG